MEKDGLVLLYEALDKKLTELAQAIDETSIKLADKDDKSFDRLMKAMVESKSIAENQLWLKTQLGLDKDVDENEVADKLRKRNPLEARAK